jgi:hypothetical protein
MRSRFSRLYFRLLFGLVRWHGFAVLYAPALADAHIGAMQAQLLAARSGYLRDGNGNSHKCGKRYAQKIKGYTHDMCAALKNGVAVGFLREGRRDAW